MKLKYLSCLLLLSIGTFAHERNKTAPDSAGIIVAGAKPELISKQFKFTEGPAVDKRGNVFFTDQPNDKIWKYDIDGKLSIFLDKAGRSNGMYFDKKGNLITCADEKNQLWSVDPKGEVKILVSDFQGHQLNGPNDVWVHPGGGIYFTDPYYQRNYWTRKTPDLDGQKVYYLKPGKSPAIAAADLQQPNGIIGTADGKYVYVADIKANKTYKYRVNKDGTLSDKQLFTNQGSDGMTIDNKGNIYLCGRGITIYNPEGKKIEQIAVSAGWTANVCFGGKKRDMLFITASEAVYSLKMQVRGVQ